uniref:DUF488 domain-containing protein n=1 Tax=viral metagenome TaxID=1070528 RepID=A0A6M3M3W8_9ZZZZ
MLKTVGYGNKKPTEFFAELKEMNPDLVIDMRDYPFKAWSGAYTKAGLEKRLGGKYLWLSVCGNVTRELPPTLRDEESCLKEIRKLMDVHGLIVLLCAEKGEQLCHRSYIRKKVKEVLG